MRQHYVVTYLRITVFVSENNEFIKHQAVLQLRVLRSQVLIQKLTQKHCTKQKKINEYKSLAHTIVKLESCTKQKIITGYEKIIHMRQHYVVTYFRVVVFVSESKEFIKHLAVLRSLVFKLCDIVSEIDTKICCTKQKKKINEYKSLAHTIVKLGS